MHPANVGLLGGYATSENFPAVHVLAKCTRMHCNWKRYACVQWLPRTDNDDDALVFTGLDRALVEASVVNKHGRRWCHMSRVHVEERSQGLVKLMHTGVSFDAHATPGQSSRHGSAACG